MGGERTKENTKTTVLPRHLSPSLHTLTQMRGRPHRQRVRRLKVGRGGADRGVQHTITTHIGPPPSIPRALARVTGGGGAGQQAGFIA